MLGLRGSLFLSAVAFCGVCCLPSVVLATVLGYLFGEFVVGWLV